MAVYVFRGSLPFFCLQNKSNFEWKASLRAVSTPTYSVKDETCSHLTELPSMWDNHNSGLRRQQEQQLFVSCIFPLLVLHCSIRLYIQNMDPRIKSRLSRQDSSRRRGTSMMLALFRTDEGPGYPTSDKMMLWTRSGRKIQRL